MKKMTEQDIERSRLWLEAYQEKQQNPAMPISAETNYALKLAQLGGRDNLLRSRKILEEQFGSRVGEVPGGSPWEAEWVDYEIEFMGREPLKINLSSQSELIVRRAASEPRGQTSGRGVIK